MKNLKIAEINDAKIAADEYEMQREETIKEINELTRQWWEITRQITDTVIAVIYETENFRYQLESCDQICQTQNFDEFDEQNSVVFNLEKLSLKNLLHLRDGAIRAIRKLPEQLRYPNLYFFA